MVLVRSDWPIQLDTCQMRKPRHVREPSSVTDGSRRNVYLLKIGAKSFRDGSQGICKYTESNLGPFACFLRLKLSKSKLYFSFPRCSPAKNNYELESIMQSALFFLSFSFLSRRGHFFA